MYLKEKIPQSIGLDGLPVFWLAFLLEGKVNRQSFLDRSLLTNLTKYSSLLVIVKNSTAGNELAAVKGGIDLMSIRIALGSIFLSFIWTIRLSCIHVVRDCDVGGNVRETFNFGVVEKESHRKTSFTDSIIEFYLRTC